MESIGYEYPNSDPINDDEYEDKDPQPLSSNRTESSTKITPEKVSSSSDKWLLAFIDQSAGLYTHTACICFCDLNGDGDQKLVIADLGDGVRGMKLNIYRGTSMLSQLTLIDCPCGVITFHMDSKEPRIPAIGVASGCFLYIYKDMKPFYKFSLPSLDVHQVEKEAWSNIRENKIDSVALRGILESLRIEIGDSNLTARSQALLELSTLTGQEEFVLAHRSLPLKRPNMITCVATMKKTVEEENNLSCIVIGTENRDIFIIEPDAFTILSSVQLPSIPVFLQVSGLFNVEYKIIVSCRDACVYMIKRGLKTGRLCVQLNSQPVGIALANGNIVVATMDSNVSCFATNGLRMWTLSTEPLGITCIAAFDIEIQGITLIAVAVDGGKIFLHNGKVKVDTIETDDVITSMKFGRYGREDNTLVMVSRIGHLLIKILKRTATFIPKEHGTSVSQVPKLILPKKSKLFLNQPLREKDEAVAIHRTFQHDLYRLRLITARSYVKAIVSSLNPMTSNTMDPLKLSAQVHGLGPIFRLVLEVQNTSLDQPSTNLSLVFSCDTKIYRISRNCIPVPYLAPGLIYTFANKVESVNELNIADIIKVYVLQEKVITPLITAIINMPASESPL
ncbi:Bardet-Biedl syndrome 1 [Brevipalpus obovatus]|uniref:Bardet-Biedl syndrome 1 n=1 Tax=Brevipalpus obovatus TaxID=246614 RepID=UPI003D9F6566